VLYADGLAGLAELCLLVYCLLDVLRTPGARIRNLPKPVWFLLCFFPPIVGPVCWLLFGRPPYDGAATAAAPARTAQPAVNPDDDEAFLRGLRERAQEQRRRAAEDDRPS
jgi:hypothetical protein